MKKTIILNGVRYYASPISTNLNEVDNDDNFNFYLNGSKDFLIYGDLTVFNKPKYDYFEIYPSHKPAESTFTAVGINTGYTNVMKLEFKGVLLSQINTQFERLLVHFNGVALTPVD